MKRLPALIIASLLLQLVYGPTVLALETASQPTENAAQKPRSGEPALPLPTEISNEPELLQTVNEPAAPLPTPIALPEANLAPQQVAESEEPAIRLPDLIINRVVAGVSGATAYEYIELYNPNPNDVTLNNWHVKVLRNSTDSKQELTLHGTVKAGSYVLVAGTDSALDAFSPDLRLKANVIVTTGGIVQLTDASNTVIEQLEWGDVTSPSLALATGTALERQYTDNIPSLAGDTAKDFAINISPQAPQSGGYKPYVTPVNRCEGVMISEIAANTSSDKQFIELYNSSLQPVVLDDCLLQTNRSTTKNFALSGALNAGQYQAVQLSATDLELTKTTSGTVYLLSSDGKEEVNTRGYDSLAADTSWAWFGNDDWRQTFALSPNGANAWQEFLPCEVGYERNPDTGRCRKMAEPDVATECELGKERNPETGRCRSVEATAELTPCKPGQTRSSETNRCRTAATVASLTPCKEGQIRNPETNRCRSIATAASTLVPCKEGQERNPDTNRCRNVTKAIPPAGFAAQPTKDSPTAFVGWWALGIVAVMATGYGVWEWRREIADGFRKLGALFTFRK